jgi:hypothetical protein
VISLQLQGEKIVRYGEAGGSTPPDGSDPDMTTIEELVKM